MEIETYSKKKRKKKNIMHVFQSGTLSWSFSCCLIAYSQKTNKIGIFSTKEKQSFFCCLIKAMKLLFNLVKACKYDGEDKKTHPV